MTNRVELQKIQERRIQAPVRPEWPEYASQHKTPRHNALMILIPLLGFALAVLLMLSFAMALKALPTSHLGGSPKPAHLAIFVL